MQHLAARFVRVASLPNVAAVPHVVDPYLDIRSQFERLDELEANIRARNLSFDVSKIAEGYAKWWEAFIDTERCEKDSPEYKVARSKMLDNSTGLLDALKLPNELHAVEFPADAPSTSRQSVDVPRWSNELDPQFAAQLELGKHIARLFPGAIRCSSPHMVRPAMVEACNYRPSQYVKITEDDGETQICLTGAGLPSLLTPFVARKLSSKTTWPVCLYSFGTTYQASTQRMRQSPARQYSAFSVLFLERTLDDCVSHVTECQASIRELLSAALGLPLRPKAVAPAQLHLHEMAASTLTLRDAPVARLSLIGDYVSRRINFTFGESSNPPNFVQMAFCDIDLDACWQSVVKTVE